MVPIEMFSIEGVVTRSVLNMLFTEKDRRLPIQFYQKCENPSFEIDREVFEDIKRKYSDLIENNAISDVAKTITLYERKQEFDHLVSNQNSPRP